VKNSVAPLPFQPLLRRNRRSVANRIESFFAVLPLLDSHQRSGHCSNGINGKTFPPIPFSPSHAQQQR